MPSTLFSPTNGHFSLPCFMWFQDTTSSGFPPASTATLPLPYCRGAPGPLLCLYALLLVNPIKVPWLYEYTCVDSSKIYNSNQAFSLKLQIHLSNCLLNIATWIFNRYFNRFKLEFLILPHKLALLTDFPANGNCILLAAQAKSLLVIFDVSLFLTLYTYVISKTCWLYLSLHHPSRHHLSPRSL